MGREIERKFLVTSDAWRGGAGTSIRQGYLSLDPERTVRIRTAGDKAWITIKGLSKGAARDEFEYAIPLKDADAMLDRLRVGPVLEKTRTRVPFAGRVWEVDEFRGENAGLVVAELELDAEDATVALPPWVGREVTQDPRYYNSNLTMNPWSRWGKP
jgi:CYTH domain-containing protein